MTQRNPAIRPAARRHAIALACGLGLSIACTGAYAQLPVLDRVQAGDAAVSSSGAQMQIETGAARSVIDWKSFSIGPGNTVSIRQPDGRSVLLNRVTGPDASSILGALQANGRIILLNPAGITVGAGARINTGALVAGAARASQEQIEQFIASGKLEGIALEGTVRNDGTIEVPQGGLVALLGRDIDNGGVILARQGTVVLAGGPKATLDFGHDGLVRIAVDGEAQGRISHTGTVIAGEGIVAMGTGAAADTLDAVVSVGGAEIANTATMRNGTIVLANAAQTVVSGRLDVSGPRGGSIKVLGNSVALSSLAGLYATGSAGNGGAVLVGGGLQGQGPEAAAADVRMDAGARIAVDGSQSGGLAVVWSEGQTRAAGTITATGGARGGLVETSGRHLTIDPSLAVNAGGKGAAGTWLLDPDHLRVSSDGGAGDVAPALIAQGLKNQNMVVMANESITVDEAIIAKEIGTDRNGARNTLSLIGAGSAGVFDEHSGYVMGDPVKRNASGAVYINAPILLKDGNLYIDATGDVVLGDKSSPAMIGDERLLHRGIVDVGDGSVWISTSLSASVLQDANTALIGRNVAVRGSSVVLESPLNYAGTLAGAATNGVFRYQQSSASGSVNVGTVTAPLTGESMTGVAARQLAYAGAGKITAPVNFTNPNQPYHVYSLTYDRPVDLLVFEAGQYVDANGAPIDYARYGDSSDYLLRSVAFDADGKSWKLVADSSAAGSVRNDAAGNPDVPGGFSLDANRGAAVVSKTPLGGGLYSDVDAGWGVDACGAEGAMNANEIQHHNKTGESQQLIVSLGTKADKVDADIGYLFDETYWVNPVDGSPKDSRVLEGGRVLGFSSGSAEGSVSLQGHTPERVYQIGDATRMQGEPNGPFSTSQQPAGASAPVQEVDGFVDRQLGQDRMNPQTQYTAPGAQAPAGQYRIDGVLVTGAYQGERYRNVLLPGTLTVLAPATPEPVVAPRPVDPATPALPGQPSDPAVVPQGPDTPAARIPDEGAGPGNEVCVALESPSSVIANYTASPAVVRSYMVQLVCKPRSYLTQQVADLPDADATAWANEFLRNGQFIRGEWRRVIFPEAVLQGEGGQAAGPATNDQE